MNSLANTSANTPVRDGGAVTGVGVMPTPTHEDVNSSSNLNVEGNPYNMSFNSAGNAYANLNMSNYNASNVHAMASLGSTL